MKDVLRSAAATHADLVIAGVSLDDGTALELIPALQRHAPGLAVLVFSGHDENLFAERVLALGARGFISKSEPIELLVGALNRVLSGGIYVSDRISQRVFERAGNRMPTRAGMAALTRRELAVFEMIGRGLGTAAIAEALALSIKTIETHRSRMRSKLGLKDTTELIRYAALWAQRPASESGSR
jgi:DNA-binding NarL/FixJ family response regulator